MAFKNPAKGATDFIVKSVGMCLALSGKKPCAVVAYAADNEVSFTALPLPAKNKLYTSADFLAAIAQAEGAARVSYQDGHGRPKDIYLCRAESGAITDIVVRNAETNRFEGNFAEVASGNPKFALAKDTGANWKAGDKLAVSVTAQISRKYERDSLEYALVNAYNACLLGRVFARQELNVETKEGRRVRLEARTSGTFDLTVLTVKPVVGADGFIESYVTEEFYYFDGDDMTKRCYKIAYSNRMNDYYLTRQ